MNGSELPEDFLALIRSVTKKRPRTVIDHILSNGFITTEELRTLYGYNHPPRAARDVREEGIPLETFRVRDSEGRSIGAYRFADPTAARSDTLAGRKVFSKEFKEQLIGLLGCRCTICLQAYEDRYLQVDHRIPYEVSGDAATNDRQLADYMLLCGSCNRAKSWSCEHCTNWGESRRPEVCAGCYWAFPAGYSHVAMQELRRLDITWAGEDAAIYDALKQRAETLKVDLPDYVKEALRRHIGPDQPPPMR
ncbi:MAG: HNH endonuclease [Candidatus Bathyanammoxibius sp.]